MMTQATKPKFSLADEICRKQSTNEAKNKSWLQDAIKAVLSEREFWTIRAMANRLEHSHEAVCASMRTMFKRGELHRIKKPQTTGARLVYIEPKLVKPANQ